MLLIACIAAGALCIGWYALQRYNHPLCDWCPGRDNTYRFRRHPHCREHGLLGKNGIPLKNELLLLHCLYGNPPTNPEDD